MSFYDVSISRIQSGTFKQPKYSGQNITAEDDIPSKLWKIQIPALGLLNHCLQNGHCFLFSSVGYSQIGIMHQSTDDGSSRISRHLFWISSQKEETQCWPLTQKEKRSQETNPYFRIEKK